MGFRCSGSDGHNYNVKWKYIKKAWVPAVTACLQNFYTKEERIPEPALVPDVQNFTLTSNGLFTYQNWTNSDLYSIIVEYKINDGEWTSLGVDGPNIDNDYYNFYLTEGISIGDTITMRSKFFDDFNHTSENWVESSTITSDYVLFDGGDITPDLSIFEDHVGRNEGVTLTLEGNKVMVNDIFGINYIYLPNNSLSGVINASGMTNIEYIVVYANQITELNAAGCFVCDYIDGGSNPLTKFNVKGCQSLRGLYLYDCQLSGKIDLHYIGDQLSYVDFDSNPSLEELDAAGFAGYDGKCYLDIGSCNFSTTSINNFFTSLGIANDSDKSYINVSDNPGTNRCNPFIATEKGWQVDGGPTLLFESSDSNTLLSSFVSRSTGDVFYMKFGDNIYIDEPANLLTIDLHGLNINGSLYLYEYLNLNTINISNATGIIFLDCSNSNALTSLNLTNATGLSILYANNTGLASFNFTGATSLAEFHISNNSVTSAPDFSMCPATFIDISNWSLNGGSLDLSNQDSLVSLYCGNAQIGSINLTGCTSLGDFWINSNRIASLDLSPCTSLTNFYGAGNTSLSSFTPSANVHSINLDDAVISSLNLNVASSSLQALSVTNCDSLTSLNLSGFSSLTSVSCGYCGSLASADISNCASLNSFYAVQSSLTSLNVSGANALNTLYLQYNSLTNTTIDSILTDLPTGSGSAYVGNNPGSTTCTASIGTNKGWQVYT